MQEKSDVQLLREYARDSNEAAFREIVVPHTDLIYSAALRQTTSPIGAGRCPKRFHRPRPQSAAVGEFTGTKRLAPRLAVSQHPVRGAQSTPRRLPRHARESQAMEILNPALEPAAEWEPLRSVLDGAMADLSEPDRDALLLRFFKNQDFRTIGESLGVSEDAAQKRVSRALERLRAEFARQGVTTTAVALSTALPANAVALAPAGLAATLATAALSGTTIAALTTLPVTKAIAMTALQKTLLTAVFVAAVGTGIFQTRQAGTLRNQVRALQRNQAPLAGQMEQLTRSYADATNRLAALRDDNERLNRNSRELLKLRGETTRLRAAAQELARLKGGGSTNNADLEESLLDRVRLLKQRLEETPEARIPEFRFLDEHDWLYAADRKLDSDADFRAAFADLRGRAEGKFLNLAGAALGKYLAANKGQYPTDLSQLETCFENPPPDEILQRYHIVPANSIPTANLTGAPGDWLITLKSPDNEGLFWAGPNGFGGSGSGEDMTILAPAMKACFDAAPTINGRKNIDMQQLAPYLTTPEQQAAYQRMMERRARNANSK